MRTICGCIIKALDFIPVLFWAWKHKQAKYCSPFPPWALRQLLVLSQCAWCVTALTSSKTRPRGAPKRACVHTRECTFFKHWAHIQHLCPGCVWSPGPQPHRLQGVWMLNIQAALRASLYLCNPFTAEEQHTLLSPFSDCTAVWSTHSRSFASAGAHL